MNINTTNQIVHQSPERSQKVVTMNDTDKTETWRRVGQVALYILVAGIAAGAVAVVHLPALFIIPVAAFVVGGLILYRLIDGCANNACKENIGTTEKNPRSSLLAEGEIKEVFKDIHKAMKEQTEKMDEQNPIPSLVMKDMLERDSSQITLEIYDEKNNPLFDSRASTIDRDNTKNNVMSFCSDQVRRSSLLFGTQEIGNAFFRHGIGLRMASDAINNPLIFQYWKASAKKTHAKVTLLDQGFRVDKLQYEMIIPQNLQINEQTGETEGSGELLVLRVVVKNVLFEVTDDEITCNFDSLIQESAVLVAQDVTPDQQKLISEFCKVAHFNHNELLPLVETLSPILEGITILTPPTESPDGGMQQSRKTGVSDDEGIDQLSNKQVDSANLRCANRALSLFVQRPVTLNLQRPVTFNQMIISPYRTYPFFREKYSLKRAQ
ncbi:MAG TPA: hypothetical protein VLE96_01500 [Chlamydiales bacterium]|nr:hypothetical protein [Chlamydiales bacterium]